MPPKSEKKGRDKTEIKSIEFTLKNALGEKKDISEPMFDEYHPKYVEAAWYEWWEKCGFFKADNEATHKEKYVMMLPPPNVTGYLHIGHGLTVSVEDCLARYNRMKGKNVLYLPGVDHAGIATQVVVEKQLMKEGKTRHDLGREKFVEKVWEWKEQYGHRINEQLRKAGASLDWSRQVFTLDDKLSNAVTEAFCRLYEKGEIFREKRLVNWSCILNTAISNIEVEHIELEKPQKLSIPGYEKKIDFGWIWSFAYPIENSDRELVVATTRPETMLGDSAIAVHPEDDRYKDLVGKFAIHPFNNRRIPIIADSYVEKDFGTGAVKITPAHDPNDFEIGNRHNLPQINVMNDDGTLNKEGFPFEGKKRFDVRYELLAQLEEKGLYRGKEPNKMSIARCSRSKDVIEPLLKPQWYVDCNKPAAMALKAMEDGDLNIYPERERKTWRQWLENIQPWCVSRQLWWGHRIPAYYVEVEGQPLGPKDDQHYWVVGRNVDEALQIAAERFKVEKNKIKLSQDPDVLDTWFSSGIFPFSTLGWPNEQDPDFKAFFPNSILETGYDILFFWVAKMVMQSLQLTGKLPFHTVFLHSMVRDKEGRKMSKSLGNVIDPMDCIHGATLDFLAAKIRNSNLPQKEVEKAITSNRKQFPKGIPECGTDALRYSLVNYSSQSSDIALDTDRIFSYRAFCNKMWQATRFSLYFFGLEKYQPPKDGSLPKASELAYFNQWILSRLNSCISKCTKALETFGFTDYTVACYDFFYRDLCDIFLEIIKPLSDRDPSLAQQTQFVLYTCLEIYFRLLHPTMPYLTEELWQRLPGRDLLPKDRESIMINPYPSPVDEWDNSEIENAMNTIMDVVKALRRQKMNYNLSKSQHPECYILVNEEQEAKVLERAVTDIQVLSIVGTIQVTNDKESIPKSCAVEVVTGKISTFMQLKGLIDVTAEKKKLESSRANIQKQHDNLSKRRKSPNYQKVPENVQKLDEERLETFVEKMKQIDQAIEDLKYME